ncbi:CHAT domain-containing protein [Mangrovivirga sp. M17]|uniref:CHAT domain-containing protein n=1 Tax=Mangrovivirga halotolerans TaxID=2993936 RepID=A0ABT3RVI2_9BACT|nr:CHAT domain-containing protein [Mangrovivirga halotolerans]MCX2745363.1 CHAT domain-containing protein [Mangrovivirga halotolerans]
MHTKTLAVFLIFQITAFLFGQNDDSVRSQFEKDFQQIGEKYYFDSPDTAALLYKKNLTKAENIQMWDQYLHAIINLASVSSHLDSLRLLDAYLQAGQKVLEKHSSYILKYDSTGFLRSNFYYFQGRYYYELFNYREAIKSYKSIIDLPEIEKDSLLFFDTHVSIAQSALNMADFALAEHHFDLARSWVPREHPVYSAGRGFDYQMAFVNTQSGHVKFRQWEANKNSKAPTAAIDHYLKALELIKPLMNEKGSWSLVNAIYRSLSSCYLESNQPERAKQYLSKLIERPTRSVSDKVRNYIHASELYLRTGNLSRADEFINKALSVVKENYDPTHRYYGLINKQKAKKFIKEKNIDSALVALDRAEKFFVFGGGEGEIKVINNYEVLEIYSLRGDAYRLKDPEEAINWYKKTISLADRTSKDFLSWESRQYLSSDIYRVFENGITTLFDLQKDKEDVENWEDDLIYFFEKNRAIQLFNSVRDIEAVEAGILSKELYEKQQQFKSKIAFNKRQIEEGRSPEKHRLILDQLYADYEDFQRSLKEKNSSYEDWMPDAEMVTFNEVISEIKGSSSLLSFFWGEENVYCLELMDDRAELHLISETPTLQESLFQYLKLIRTPPENMGSVPEELYNKGNKLYELFSAASGVKDSKINSIIIIPDGPLSYLPFGALVSEKKKWLLERKSLYYSSAIRLLLKSTKSDNKATDLMKYLGFAPDYAVMDNQNFSGIRKDLSPLAYNNQEVKSVENILGGRIFTGREASEVNFNKYAENASILHLSAHAIVDNDNPNYSAVYFIDQTDSARHEQRFELDGALHLYELYNYQFNSELAVLSACETGFGRWARGEGVISLGRAFQSSGCPSVTMSLWNISDKSSSLIIESYFKYLNEGMAKDEALAMAKKDFLSDPANKYFKHPYYWSAFIVQGNAQPLSKAQNEIWYLVLGIVIIMGLYLGIRKSKNNRLISKKDI